MKAFRVAAVFAAVILLSSCVSPDKPDINILTERLNGTGCFTLNTERYRITDENGLYKYSQLIDDNTMLCVYTNSDGIAVRCTLTSLKADENFKSRCSSAAEIFMQSDRKTALRCTALAFENGTADSGGFRLVLIDSAKGKTFLISYADDEIHTNESPTLKGYIDKNSITRPTVGSTETPE